MTTHIKVYPTKASALNAHHPLAGAPRIEGVDWPYDAFTCRRLSDGSFTEDPAKAYKPPPAEAAKGAADKPAPIGAASASSKPQEITSDDGKSK